MNNTTIAFLVGMLLLTTVCSQSVVDSMGDADSSYGSEYGGYENYETSCLVDEFKCDTEDICLHVSLRCNGEFDCPDMSDESNCTANATEPPDYPQYPDVTCEDGQFDCGSSICINMSLVCDGAPDCSDGLDEEGCATTTSSITTTTAPDYEYEDCNPGEFQCSDGLCIPEDSICDGFDDCADGRDELSCPISTTTSSTTTTTAPDYEYEDCNPGEFQCSDGVCVPEDALCDGFDDCSDGLDELNCSSGIAETTTNFTPRPATTEPTNTGPQCFYEGQTFPAGAEIVSNNCTEVTCSSTGHLLTWQNPDPTCVGSTPTPTATISSTTPMSPNTSSNLAAWRLQFTSWRQRLFDDWLNEIRNYVSNVNVVTPTEQACPTWPAAHCNNSTCVLDVYDCPYCYCPVSSADSRSTLQAAWERDLAFWESRLEPAWTAVYESYKASTERP